MTQKTRLSRVPTKWQTSRLKYLAKFRAGENITAESIRPEGEYPVYGGNGLRGYTDSYTHEGEAVLLGRQGALCGNVNYAHGRFWASEHAVVVKPSVGVHIRWFGELLRTMNLGTYSVSAAQPGLSVEYVSNLRAPLPPFETQRRIADFLDAATAEIDALVAEKERMLALLEEKRAALVTQAVTRGLDPNVSLKPSGLEWLGEIPEHWRVMRFKHFARIGNGSTPNREDPEYWEAGDFPWLNSSVVGDRTVQVESRFVTEAALTECHLPKIAPPALLVAITGQGKTRGRSTVLKFEATINQHLAYVKPAAAAADCLYLSFLMDAAYDFIRSDSDGAGSTRGAITCEQLGNFRLPLPPLPEQKSILDSISARTMRFDSIEESASASILLLKERRSALITAAVTGQIPIDEMTA